MNSTATFDIAPFGTNLAGEEELGRRRVVVERRVGGGFPHRAGPQFTHRFQPRVGLGGRHPGLFAHRVGPSFGHRLGSAFGHRPGAPFGHRAGPAFGHHFRPALGHRFGPALGHRAGAPFGHRFAVGHGLFAHRFARDFRHRVGLRPPFGFPPAPDFTAGVPPFDAGVLVGPPPGLPPIADAGAPPAVAAGSEEQIRWIQFVLNSVLGASLPTDGIPSPELRSALQSFQSQQGLPVSGFAGPDTIAALQNAAAAQAAAGAPQPDAAAAAPDAGGDAQSGEFEMLPAFGAPNTPRRWRFRRANQ